jgi:MFS family permease
MPAIETASPRNLVVSATLAFAAFGAFWGVWGASVPRVEDQAGVSDGQLGLALLFVGAGALPAMLLAGPVLDRWGLRVAALVLGALGVLGAALAVSAVNLVALCIALALVGASSGAADVAMNAVAGRAEQLAGRPVITRAHGVFSTFVVIATLATGLSSAGSRPLAFPFFVVAALAVAAGTAMARNLPPRAAGTAADASSRVQSGRPADRPRVVPLVLVGILGALAFASENAHQSWSAVFAHEELRSGAGLASVAPAVFAGTVAVTRFAIGGLAPEHARRVLLVGAAGAGAGAAVLAAAPNLLVAGTGLAIAAAGTGMLFPTLVGLVSRNVPESHRGRATSVVTTVSYLGFLLGPVYVGAWAAAFGLRAAMLAVAALAGLLFALVPGLLRLSGFFQPAR